MKTIIGVGIIVVIIAGAIRSGELDDIQYKKIKDYTLDDYSKLFFLLVLVFLVVILIIKK
jgi:hypothetical protein